MFSSVDGGAGEEGWNPQKWNPKTKWDPEATQENPKIKSDREDATRSTQEMKGVTAADTREVPKVPKKRQE